MGDGNSRRPLLEKRSEASASLVIRTMPSGIEPLASEQGNAILGRKQGWAAAITPSAPFTPFTAMNNKGNLAFEPFTPVKGCDAKYPMILMR